MNISFENLPIAVAELQETVNGLVARLEQFRQIPEIEKDEILTVQETAKFLSISVATVYTLCAKGELPVMKRSKRSYFLRSDLIAYLKAGRKKTNAEIALTASAYVAKGPKV